MKTIFASVLLSFLLVLAFQTTFAQGKAPKVNTVEFTVTGVCGMCEDRIENAALIKGVKLAEWDKETQLLRVIYRPKKTNEEAIHEAVAAHGHDTGKIQASDAAYAKLPACCAYRDGVEVH